jgi:hypothetical protein
VQAKHLYVARICSSQSLTDFDGSCFTSPIRSQKTEAFPDVHFEVESVDRDHLLVCLFEIADAKSKPSGSLRHARSIAFDGRMFKA